MIKIHGQSDDLVVLSGGVHAEAGDMSLIRVGTDVRGVLVRMLYSESNTACVWSASVSQVAEDAPVPWTVTIAAAEPSGRPASVYSVAVTIDCPAGTPVTIEGDEREYVTR